MKSLSTISTKIHSVNFIILFALLITLVAVTTAQASSTDVNIIGGKDIEAGAYPWTVALIENAKDDVFWAQYCGGTLVHPQWVLTAAHCTYNHGREMVPSEIDIIAGQDELRATNGERIAVEQIIRHPNYNRAHKDADLALIKLATPSTQPTVKMADLSMKNIDESGVEGTVIGWGKTESNIRVNHLKEVNVPLVVSETCASAYSRHRYTPTGNMLCAGYAEGGKDACSGDSGGPLVIRNKQDEWVQVGVVSWGKGCAKANAYGVYTHVALFTGWISLQITMDMVVNAAGTTSVPPIEGQSSEFSQFFLPVVTR